MTTERARGTYLGLTEAISLVDSLRLPVVPWVLVRSATEAVDAAGRLRYPVALKVVSLDILHKSDCGGVRTRLESPDDVAAAYSDIISAIRSSAPDARIEGILVQAMAPAGIEMMVAARRDPAFGPYLALGMGGTWVEVLSDIEVGLLPLSKTAIRRVIDRLRSAPLLKGYRGGLHALGHLIDLAYCLGEAFTGRSDLMEIELNPVILSASGAHVVDVRVLPGGPTVAPQAPADPAGAVAALRTLTKPNSVAVIGSSNQQGKVGNLIMQYMIRHGASPRVYPIHATQSEVVGRRAYTSIDVVLDEIDVACVAVPAEAVAHAVTAAGNRGVRVAVVFSAGFAEAGKTDREAEILQAARRASMRVLGPNSIGVISPASKTYLSFSQCLEEPEPRAGEIGLVSHSGALMGSLISQAWEMGLGFSHCFSTGNEADLDASDCIRFLVEEPTTKVIAAFLEGTRNGPKFRSALEAAREAGKPVVVYKVGRSEAAKATVQSHTANVAGVDAVFGAVLRQTGAVQVSDLYGLYDTALALAWLNTPASDRVAVLSTSGGACSLVADQLEQAGLVVPALGQETQSQLRSIVPDSGIVANPIDLTGVVVNREGMLAQALAIVGRDPAIDSIAIVITTIAGSVADRMAEMLIECADLTSKPVIIAWTIDQHLVPGPLKRLREAHLPVFPTPERAVRALKNLLVRRQLQADDAAAS